MRISCLTWEEATDDVAHCAVHSHVCPCELRTDKELVGFQLSLRHANTSVHAGLHPVSLCVTSNKQQQAQIACPGGLRVYVCVYRALLRLTIILLSRSNRVCKGPSSTCFTAASLASGSLTTNTLYVTHTHTHTHTRVRSHARKFPAMQIFTRLAGVLMHTQCLPVRTA